jgi:MSHA pilin protein MshD
MCTEPRRRSRGLSLVEVAVFIFIVGIGVAGVVSVLNFSVQHSADPFPVKQALAVAEGLLDEILAKSYSTLPGTGSRNLYDDVDDYNGYSVTGVTAVDGTPLTGLSNYKVDVAVAATTLNGSPAKLVTVTVTYPASGGTPYRLSGYRTSY